MASVCEKLGEELIHELEKADEVWVAVALMSNDGLEQLFNTAKEHISKHLIVGIDLPTHPKVLNELSKKTRMGKAHAKVYSNKAYFHPKVYICRIAESYVAFVGSGNATNGGFADNIEMSVRIEDQHTCRELLVWYGKMQKEAQDMTPDFLAIYKAKFEERKILARKDHSLVNQLKQEAKKENEAIFSERKEFLKVLRRYRRKKNYTKVKQHKADVIEELRDSLDYPKFENIDIDHFFSIEELGHILSFPKPTIRKRPSKFKKLLRMLCQEDIDIVTRYDSAVSGKMKIEGISEALVSKVLTIHDPNKYFVRNGKSEDTLKKYGIKLPRRLSAGEKYEIIARELRRFCEESNIDNLAVLDEYLYQEASQE